MELYDSDSGCKEQAQGGRTCGEDAGGKTGKESVEMCGGWSNGRSIRLLVSLEGKDLHQGNLPSTMVENVPFLYPSSGTFDGAVGIPACIQNPHNETACPIKKTTERKKKKKKSYAYLFVCIVYEY